MYQRNFGFTRTTGYVPQVFTRNAEGSLIIEDINALPKVNHPKHHTDVFERKRGDDDVIVRRGQEFRIVLITNRAFDLATDLLEISMESGDKPNRKNETLIKIPLGVNLDPLQWGGRIVEVKVNSIIVDIMPACNSIVGEWLLKAVARHPGDPSDDPPVATQDIIMLFNPWCPEDDVYLEDKDEIGEYVLNETGKIWRGSYKNMTSIGWNYGQFEDTSLRTAMRLLDSSPTANDFFNSATAVARTLSQMANANDNDGGLLIGNWSGNYSDGTAPTKWKGSVPIFEEYLKTKKAVKYAQCWVFCGVMTTVCRTLGIPTRSVTNFSSAHDTDGSLTVDHYFHARSWKYLKKESRDSIWNYHCWNEVYMKRSDLPPEYHRWQVVDGTPQELSGSAMRCGPASVAAIKEGNILQDFDVPFVFAEMNGDTVYWLRNDDGSREFYANRSDRIGKNISTKMVGSDERNDITKTYKESDGSFKERVSFLSALRYSRSRELAGMVETIADVKPDFNVTIDASAVCTATLTCRNESSEERNCNFSVTVLHSNDIGDFRGDFRHEPGKLKLAPNSEATWSMTIKAVEWLNLVVGDGRLMFYLEGFVKETHLKFVFQEGPSMDKPELEVTASTLTPSTNNSFDATATFKNITGVELTECSFTFEGVGTTGLVEVPVGNCGPNQSISGKVSLTPRLPGVRQLVAGFDSKQLTDFVGYLTLTVKKGKAPKVDPEEEDEDISDDEFTPSKTPVLKVTDVDLRQKANGFEHHTDEYEHNEKENTLVVRRGQVFNLTVAFDRPPDPKIDKINLILQAGPHPRKSEDTNVRLERCPPKDLPSVEWGYSRTKANADGSKWDFGIKFAPDACIAEWRLQIRTKLPNPAPGVQDRAQYSKTRIFTLFNPWCKDDQVYLDNEDEREEYVLNPHGWVFRNSRRNPRNKWFYGQFDEVTLNTAMKILELCGTKYATRGSAARLSRDISQMCNNCDTGGILWGNWSGKYDDGVRPTTWRGSVKIFEQWHKNEYSGVKYGQCWVFAAITTSVCRSLGLPCRPVTCFGSAHDTDYSLTIDKYFDPEGEPLNYSGDSVWNFHVWNEAWFSRPDLPDGLSGWQAFDSTPQEPSGGLYRCGPVSINAIYQAQLGHRYDARFVFAEVNSDRVDWTYNTETGEKKIRRVRKASVGSQLATKAVGKYAREDVMGNYKPKEGTAAERRQVNLAVVGFSMDERLAEIYSENVADPEIKGTIESSSTANADVSVTWQLENTSSSERTLKYGFVALASYYTGEIGDKIKEKRETTKIPGGEKTTLSLEVKAEEWLNKVKSDGILQVQCHFKCNETNQTEFEVASIDDLEKPSLDVKASNSKPKLKEEVKVTVGFENPLDNMELTNVTMSVDGDGFGFQSRVLKNNIPPHGSVSETFTVVPRKAGKTIELMATLDCDQLTDIDGFVEISPQKA